MVDLRPEELPDIGEAVAANDRVIIVNVSDTSEGAGGKTCDAAVSAVLAVGLGANVGAFLATPSSANLRAALTDETGSGAAVFADTPFLVAPILGEATADTINKVSITGPATLATLTIANLATLYASASTTLNGGTHSGTNTGDQTNISGNAATVTTNANLTGHVTSAGNAAVLGSFTVAQLNTAISDADVATGGGTATGTNTGDQTNISGNAATVTTNANLTGHVTSTGNAAVLGSFTMAQLNAALSDLKLWTTKHKVTTETINTDAALTDDAELVVALAASTKYTIRAVLYYNTANATMDFKFGTAYSGTVTGTPQSYFDAIVSGAVAGAGIELAGQVAGLVVTQSVTGTTFGAGRVHIEQIITTNGAGNWSLQWAQVTSDGGNLSVMYGSYIEYRAVA